VFIFSSLTSSISLVQKILRLLDLLNSITTAANCSGSQENSRSSRTLKPQNQRLHTNAAAPDQHNKTTAGCIQTNTKSSASPRGQTMRAAVAFTSLQNAGFGRCSKFPWPWAISQDSFLSCRCRLEDRWAGHHGVHTSVWQAGDDTPERPYTKSSLILVLVTSKAPQPSN